MLEKQPKLIPSLKAAFKNRPFIFGAGIYLLTWMTIVVLETNLLIYIKYILGRQGQSSLIMASIFVTAIFALPIWNWAAKHWNKRLAYIIGVSFWAVVMIVLIMVTPQTPFWIIMVLCIMAGIGVSAAQVLPWAIIPDAIEWDEWMTFERHEGMFYSLITLLGKIVTHRRTGLPARFAGHRLPGRGSRPTRQRPPRYPLGDWPHSRHPSGRWDRLRPLLSPLSGTASQDC